MAASASEEQQLISEEWRVKIRNFLEEGERAGTVARLSMLVPKESASEEQQLISEEWIVEVKSFLKGEPPGILGIASMKVPKTLINAKPEAYIPQMVSLGPYHHRSLQEEPIGPYHQRMNHLSQMDIYKLKSTRDAAKTKPIEDFFRQVREKASQFEQFYDWKINDQEKFGWMMVVNALFLYQFLQREAKQRQTRHGEILTPTLTSIRCDIVKLENQIPLFLLKEIDNKALEDCLHSHIPRLSCFQVSGIRTVGYEDEHHLLGCMHKYVSSFLQIHNSDEDKPRNLTYCEQFITVIGNMTAIAFGLFFLPQAIHGRDFLNKCNATELVKAGIKFKSGSWWDKIKFDKHTNTVCLPKIVISDTFTEVLMRNLLALEFNDTSRPKHVTQYVKFMDFLIDTPEDVTLLRKCHIIDIHSSLITDEYVAKMWEDLSKPMFSSDFKDSARELKAGIRKTLIRNFYKFSATRNRIRDWGKELHKEYLSTPWKTIGLLAAVYVVALTTIQTYFSFKD